MPNGQRRNRNSRHANTQRNLQNASVIEASAIAEIVDVVVAAEEYVDNSAEIERLKSRLDIQKNTIIRLKKNEKEALLNEKHALLSIDSFTKCLKVLRDEEGVINMSQNSDGSIKKVVPKCIYRNGEEISFKGVPKLLDQQDELMVTQVMLINRQEEEIKKLKTFCKSLITKDKEVIKNMISECDKLDNLSKIINKQDDDLVCDINFSDEESDEEEEDFMSHKTFIQRGKHYSYNEKYELYDDDFQFIKKFDSKFKMIAHFMD